MKSRILALCLCCVFLLSATVPSLSFAKTNFTAIGNIVAIAKVENSFTWKVSFREMPSFDDELASYEKTLGKGVHTFSIDLRRVDNQTKNIYKAIFNELLSNKESRTTMIEVKSNKIVSMNRSFG